MILAGLVGAALLQASMTSQAAVVVYSLTVPTTAAWYDTGIDVSAGTVLTVSATGTIIYGPFPGQTVGPNGPDVYAGITFDPAAVYPSTVVVSLIGKIGGTTAIGTGTPVPAGVPGNGAGFVGSSYNQVMLNSGRLFLGYNDEIGAFGDNHGSFSVTVTVPEPSAAAIAGLGAIMLMAFRRRKLA